VAPARGDAYASGVYVDEWNCRWRNLTDGVHGEISEAAIPSLDDLSSLVLPRETLTLDREKVNVYCGSTDTFVLQGSWARPFERVQFLRTTENALVDVAECRPVFLELLHQVHNHYLKEMDLWAETKVDALVFMDDWGAQNALLISPETWRAVFKPLYRQYVDLAHAHGKKCFMHSDGNIVEIIPDLIEIGVDALNSQLFCMGLRELERFRGEICFWGEIDRQRLLPFGTRAEITQAVLTVYESLYQRGGVIGQCEFGPGAKPENIRAVLETWNSISES
jgi:hypothetical protein